LQTKQTQYDTNWNALNNLYGQLYGADLTHDLNIKKKDELLKQIDFNLKRVSGLDLSLEQNVNQAMQVFRPFYEDKYLIKDMAWTKNFKNTYNNALALKNSSDEKQALKYWDTGIKGLEYRRQMFKDATLDETLNMGDAQYTPKVDVIKEYMDFAKKYDIGMVTQTPEGMYLVRKKNGEQLLPGLQQIFWAQYANRPDMQAFFKEEAFVERMEYAYQNADKFNGNKLEAEKDYIKKKYDWLKNLSAGEDVKAKNELNTARNLNANLQSDVQSGNVNPQQGSYEQELNELLGVTTQVEQVKSDLNNQLNANPSNVPENRHTDDILNNIELARLKVDAGYAAYKAGTKIDEAAGSYAYSNYEVEYKPNAVAIAQFREASANARLQTAHQMKLAENQQAEQLKRITKYQDEMVANGRAYRNPDGSIELNPQVGGYEFLFEGRPQESGQSDGTMTPLDQLNQEVIDKTILEKLGPGVNNIMEYVNNQVNGDNGSLFTNQQLGQILNHFRPTDPEIDKMIDQGKSYPNQAKAKEIWNQIYSEYANGDKTKFIKQPHLAGSLYHLNNYLVTWNKKHSGNTLAQQYNTAQSTYDLEVMARRHTALELTRIENTKKIESKFRENLTYNANKLKEQGFDISNDKINNTVDLVMNEYVKSGYNWSAMRKNAPEIDKLIAGTLGGNFIKSTEANRDRSWYEYIPGIYTAEALYDAATGNRKNVTASWVNDILNKSYNELALDKDPKKSLQTFIETTSRGVDEQGNAGAALSSKTQSVKVDIDYAGDFGYQAAQQAIQDALGLPMGDDTKFKFAFGNNIPTNEDGEIDYSQDGLNDNIARALLQKLYSKMGDKSIGDFILSSSRVAMENRKLGSTTFGIPKAIVDDVINSLEGGEYTEQQLKQMKDRIIQNGVTAIAPHEYWTHKLFNASVPTATEVVLRNKPIEFSSIQGGGSYKISKASGVPGQDYNAVMKLRVMNSDGIVEELEYAMDPKTSGKSVDEIEKHMWQAIAVQDQENLKTFRSFHKSNKSDAITKAMQPENFGKAPNKSFWKY
jgi:hypothetical protein